MHRNLVDIRDVDSELPQAIVPFPNGQRETHDLGHVFGNPRRLGARPRVHSSREYQRPGILRWLAEWVGIYASELMDANDFLVAKGYQRIYSAVETK